MDKTFFRGVGTTINFLSGELVPQFAQRLGNAVFV